MIFPNINANLKINTEKETSTSKKVGRSFYFDFKTKRFKFKDGKNVETSSLEAIEQWIKLVLFTHKDKFEVFKNTSFYCNIDNLIGQKPNSFVKAALIGSIKESLSKNDQIERTDNFSFKYEHRLLTVSFTVFLKDKSILNIEESL